MSTQTSSLLDIARSYWEAGLTPVPHVAGVEAPSYLDPSGCIVPLAWGQYKELQPDRATVERWFQRGDLTTVRIELLTGSAAVSKYDAPARLQILDFECADVFEAFLEYLHFSGHSPILYRCTIERTPSEGAHVGFLCTAIDDRPKLKLALTRRADGREKILIELLMHHLCTVAPTRVAWKPDRPPKAGYRLTQGTWAQPQVISPDQRHTLLGACRVFNEVPAAIVDARPRGPGEGTRPGDTLNEAADSAWWRDLLTRHGWKDVSRSGRQGLVYFQRPGKVGRTCSATYGKTGKCLYVFSSNAAPFEPDTAYTPFGAYALLEHDGDFAAAAKALAKASGLPALTPEHAPSPPTSRSWSLLRSRAAHIARYRAQINADPYFGAPERRGTGITPAILVLEKETTHA
jgi:putative DNA primase/helicase